jgi:hypothetical protein
VKRARVAGASLPGPSAVWHRRASRGESSMPNQMMMSIHDDQTGEGTDLAFPTMSTCAAIVCVLPNTLVGIHKTQGWRASTATLFGHALGLINGAAVREIYIAGWNMHDPNAHDPAQIIAALNCANVPFFVCNYSNSTQTVGNVTQAAYKAGKFVKKANDLCTFAFHKGNADPEFGMKRTPKVLITAASNQAYNNHLAQHGGYGTGRYFAMDEGIATPSGHLHPLRKHIEFT